MSKLERTELMEEMESAGDRTRDPVSCIKQDDFEVYLRIQTYQNTIQRPILKFLNRAKWVSTRDSIDIFKEF